jgi:hypothetical protein
LPSPVQDVAGGIEDTVAEDVAHGRSPPAVAEERVVQAGPV